MLKLSSYPAYLEDKSLEEAFLGDLLSSPQLLLGHTSFRM